ncbi:MAG: ketoacyl-ACP synthase III [Desulfobacterales bacterium]|nr:MAG: ketoacyl-ACP synthase III [Desulfobacterales bacterium]
MRTIIAGVGHFVPDRKLSNKDFEEMVDTNDEWITTRTGIKERRILDKNKGTSHMAAKAAKMVLKQTQISADEIDLIIVATVTPDRPVPATAAFVQKQLNAKNCWGYDLNGGCTGFLCALATGSQFIETGRHQKVLVIGADKMSSIINYKDRTTCVLFGDAAGAVLLEPSNDDGLGVEDFILHLDGLGADYLEIPAGGSLQPASRETVAQNLHFVYQDGRTVFKHAVSGMAEVSAEIMEKNKLTNKDIKCLIPHQANLRIIDAAAKRMGLNPDQVVINISKYGNTTAATIPLAMSEAYQERKIRKGDWIVISAFGAGFTWGSLLLKWAI